MKQWDRAGLATCIASVPKKRPLVHHITNYVTVNDCANIVLAIGAAPVMADDIREIGEIVAISQAVVLNIGTLHERTIQAMYAAGQAANQLGIPVVLDPVGAGASGLRTETAARLIRAVKLAVIRGNLSEMKALAGQAAGTRGVDASAADAVERDSLRAVTDFAKSLAQKTGSVIALTGAIDVVSDGVRCCAIHNGHAMMARITGTGCMCSSLVGACCGATDDYAVAAAAGVMVMGVAGELALEALQSAGLGSGSYRSYIIDAVSHMTGQVLVERGKADFE